MADYKQALPTGYELDKYRLLSVLGFGGFGITYLAENLTLGHRVAIKEYLPNEFAMREARTIHPKSPEEAENFAWGLEKFKEEARTLTRFRHPNLVRVSDYFEANNTAYIVMDYEDGESLNEILRRKSTLTEDQLKRVVLPIADGLRQVHAAGYLHRDIKPGNIYVRLEDETPVLLDFGAARQDIGNRTRSMLSVASAGYSPMEQYESDGNQGPWTDIYSLSAVCYKAITGDDPPEATRRESQLLRDMPDPLPSLLEMDLPGYSRNFLQAVEAGLEVIEKRRPQSVEEWLELMPGERVEPPTDEPAPALDARAVKQDAGTERRSPAVSPAAPSSPFPQWLWLPGLAVLTSIAGIAYFWPTTSTPRDDELGLRPPQAIAGAGNAARAGDAPESRPSPRIAGLGDAILVVETTPPGVEVLLDGETIGSTPLRRADLLAGFYDLSLRHPAYETAVLPGQDLVDNRVLRISRTLQRGVGALTLLVDPLNAWVELDGVRMVDRTPVTLEDLPAGELMLTLGAEEHRTEVVTVTVPKDGIGVFEHELEPVAYGTLALDLEPPDANVEFPALALDYSPDMRLQEGVYQLVVSREGFVASSLTVAVAGDTRRQVALVRQAEAFTVAVTPPGAEVDFVGRADEYREGMLLPPGEYRLRIASAGYQPLEVTVPHGAEPTIAEFTLERELLAFGVTVSPANADVEFLDIDETYRPGMELPPGEYRLRFAAEGYAAREVTLIHESGSPQASVELARELPAPGARFRDCPECPELVALDAGEFRMGCMNPECSEDELPVRTVTVAERFALGRHEVTIAEFRRFADAMGYQTAAERLSQRGCRTLELLERQQWEFTPGRNWRDLEYPVEDAQPVVCVNWFDVQAYLEWLSASTGEAYRLPSEAEWEFAARAGAPTPYFFGSDEELLCDYANVADQTELPEGFAWGSPADCDDGHIFPAPAASFLPNAFGLHDMHGNVWEWVQDCWNGNYLQAPQDAGARLDGDCDQRAIRGGSWATSAALNRTANRGSNPSLEGGAFLGFRVARSLVP
ncbi:MAG: SUMF1/EgtB/PvdO family nonheme iron enzyme [Gammaproteobacteria bacterium]|nr:SUMF1/EgtB/PvdO family nonheme iron enzyme [Gammaproteobacteria bacterium]MYC59519.1 SUMF1/EgtB/PvdO family nonheme iron enzyme [Gammaproteobacteria bacterium]MYH85309.1 SUMF1/EgtB/PvdO family nonheme iron enzyme [Gammaproteobacteria bacterium]MYK03815.1 SUMF1/EgtB/PvdO family nonheme iron enzyme [Gammaproteobacteria bacterium]